MKSTEKVDRHESLLFIALHHPSHIILALLLHPIKITLRYVAFHNNIQNIFTFFPLIFNKKCMHYYYYYWYPLRWVIVLKSCFEYLFNSFSIQIPMRLRAIHFIEWNIRQREWNFKGNGTGFFYLKISWFTMKEVDTVACNQ